MEILPKDEGLRRVIGITSLTTNAVNLTIGAGIFALPAIVAIYIGAAGIVAYLICSFLVGLVLMCFVELGSKIPSSGGAYAYVEAAFGPFAGFLINTLYWLGFGVTSAAAIINILADNLAVFFPVFHLPLNRALLFLILIIIVTVVNIRGTRSGSWLVIIGTIAKLLPLMLLVSFGFFSMKSENLEITEWPGFDRLGEVSLILFFAFGGGIEATLNAGGEIRNPKRTIPISFLSALLIVSIIYVSIQLVSQGVLGADLIKHRESPLVAVAENIFGHGGKILLVWGAVISCFSLMCGDLLASPRVPYAAARDGLLPKFLGKLHPIYATPYWAIISYAIIILILSITSGFKQLAILSSSAVLLIYAAVILATIKLHKKKIKDSFVIPGGYVIPIIALISTIWFLSHLTVNEILSTVIFLSFFSLVYFLTRGLRKK